MPAKSANESSQRQRSLSDALFYDLKKVIQRLGAGNRRDHCRAR